MPPKDKGEQELVNPLIYPPIDFHHISLADRDHKIHETLYECDLFEMYCWLKDKCIDKYDDIQLWESNLPDYIFPRTNNIPEFVRKCQACYLPSQRAIIAPTGEVLLTITPQAIDQMMQAPTVENATPFSYEALIELYQKLDFTKRAKTLELFLT